MGESAIMGISRDSRHKRSASGAKRAYYRKKRAFEAGRQESNTRIGAKRIHLVRTRGGNHKYRALRLNSFNFSWASEGIARKVRVIVVAYHPSNNELVRTNTLTRSAIVQIDAAPFRQWYEAHYGSSLGRRRQAKAGEKEEDKKKSNSVSKKQADRLKNGGKIENAVEKQFEAGRLYAAVSSRPERSLRRLRPRGRGACFLPASAQEVRVIFGASSVHWSGQNGCLVMYLVCIVAGH